MAELPRALVKDLLSTGYFFEELKKYTESKEIDLASLSRDFALPYLVRKSESYQRAGKTDRIKILGLAVKFLHEASDVQMAETIFGLRRVAASEEDVNSKTLCANESVRKSERFSCREKLEEAQSLGKMLTSIVRAFGLSEMISKRDKSEAECKSLCDEITEYWELAAVPAVNSPEHFQ